MEEEKEPAGERSQEKVGWIPYLGTNPQAAKSADIRNLTTSQEHYHIQEVSRFRPYRIGNRDEHRIVA